MGLGIDTNTDGNKSKYQHFTEAERYKIEGYKQIKMSHRKIAIELGKSYRAREKP